jgi:enamine deaminase RidA (YjgF/YER057c/UK114 family)
MSGVPIQPDGWLKPRGYSNGMRARGEIVAVAGQIGWNARGELVEGDFAAQFEQALANVVDVVRAAGGKAEDLVSLTIFITDRGEYLSSLAAIGEGYRKLMGRHYPTMACIVIAGLLEPRAKVEIQGLAVLP